MLEPVDQDAAYRRGESAAHMAGGPDQACRDGRKSQGSVNERKDYVEGVAIQVLEDMAADDARRGDMVSSGRRGCDPARLDHSSLLLWKIGRAQHGEQPPPSHERHSIVAARPRDGG